MLNAIKIIFCLLFILSCKGEDGKNGSITNPTEPEYPYSVMLQLDTLQVRSKHSVDIAWEIYPYDDFTSYTLIDIDGDKIIEEDIALENTNYNMNFFPGMIQETCVIAISNGVADTTFSDTIQFFTMPLAPPTNLTISSESEQNELSWTASTDDISEITVYRYQTELTDPPIPVINVDSTEPDILWENIFTGTNVDILFTDTDIYPQYYYFYMIKARIQDLTENLDGYIYSYIAPDVNDLLKEPEQHNILMAASESYKSMIKVEWASYTFDDFYKYKIWRADTPEELETLEDDELLIEIIDKNINYFEDRNNIGTGKTWYYKMRVYNMYGNYIESSDAISGYTIL